MRALALAAACLALPAAGARAELPVEETGRSETLPQAQPHWAWAADIVLRRSALVDLDSGRFLGMVSTGLLSPTAVFAQSRAEFYLPETYYSRGSRGERSDVVSFYDSASLGVTGEVALPPRRAVNVLPVANAALSDDDRFLAVFNMNPATSLSVVDARERRFAGEIQTPGCSLVYAAGPRRFLMICGDGALLTVTLDERGRAAGLERSAPFFDPLVDPVTEKAVRRGDRWFFASFEGSIHEVDVSGGTPRFAEPWSLLGEGDAGWRIGGIQHLALHGASGRLYALMHQGGPDTHKEPGRELWVYDLAQRARVARIRLRHPGLSFLSETVEFGRSWPSPLDRISDWLLDHAVPNPGLHQVQVTQDEAPLLVTGSMFGGSLAVYDARSGEILRRVSTGNLSIHTLQTPWGGR